MSTLFDKLFKTTQRDKQRFGMLYESFLKSKRRSRYQREENARIKSKSSLLDKSKFLYDIPDSMIFPNTADKDETEQNADVFLKEFGELLDNDYYLPESVLVQLGLSHLIEKNDNTEQKKSTVDPQKTSNTKTVSNNAFPKDRPRSMNFPITSNNNTGSRDSSTKNTNQEILEKINSLKRKFNAQSGQPLQTGIMSPKRISVGQNQNTSSNENNLTNNNAVVTEKTRVGPNLKNNQPSHNSSNNSDDLEVVFCETKINLNPLLKSKSMKKSIKLTKTPTNNNNTNNTLSKSVNKVPSVALQKSGNTLNKAPSPTKIPDNKTSAKSTVTTHLHDIPSNVKTNTNIQSSISQIPSSTSQRQNKQDISKSKTSTKKSKVTRKKNQKRNPTSMFESLLAKHLPFILNSMSQLSQVPIQVSPQTSWPENHLSPILNNSEVQNGSLNPNNLEDFNRRNLTMSQSLSFNNPIQVSFNNPIQVPIILPRNQCLETSNANQGNRTEDQLHSVIKSEVDHTNVGHLVNNENDCTNASRNGNMSNPTQNDNRETNAPYYSTTNATKTPSNNHLTRSEVINSIMDSILCLTSDRQTQLDTILKTELEYTQQDHLSSNQDEINHPSESEHCEQVTNEINDNTNLNQVNAPLPMCTNEGESSAIETQRPLIFLKSPSQLLKDPSTTLSEEVSTQAKDGNSTTEKIPASLDDICPNSCQTNSTSTSVATNSTSTSVPLDKSSYGQSSGCLFSRPKNSTTSSWSNKFGVNIANLFSREPLLEPSSTSMASNGQTSLGAPAVSSQPESSNDLETRQNTPAISSPSPHLWPLTGNPVQTGPPKPVEQSGTSQNSNTCENSRKVPEQHPTSLHLKTQTTSQETHNSSWKQGQNSREPTLETTDHESVLNKMLDFNTEMMKLLVEQKNQLEELMKEKKSTETCYACTKVNDVLDDKDLTDDRKLVRLKIIQRNQRV